MKCHPTNNVMPISFEECCRCPHYENCSDKRELKRIGLLWMFVRFLKNNFARIRLRKA